MNLTPIEQKIYSILQDLEYHPALGLQMAVIGRRHVSPSLIPTHINRLKAKLPDEVTIEHSRKEGYRLVEKAK